MRDIKKERVDVLLPLLRSLNLSLPIGRDQEWAGSAYRWELKSGKPGHESFVLDNRLNYQLDEDSGIDRAAEIIIAPWANDDKFHCYEYRGVDTSSLILDASDALRWAEKLFYLANPRLVIPNTSDEAEYDVKALARAKLALEEF